MQILYIHPVVTFFTDDKTKYWLKLYNCDDVCIAYANSDILDKVRWGDSDWKEIPKPVNGKSIKIIIDIQNESSGYTYGFIIRKDKEEIVTEECGKNGNYGCGNDVQDARGIIDRFLYEFK